MSLTSVICKVLETIIRDHILDFLIYIIKEKLETWASMESYLPTSDRHAASWIFSDGPSKPLGVVKLRYNALKLFFFIMSLFYANVPVSGTDSHSRQFLMRENSFETASTSVDCIGGIRIGSYDIRSRKLQGMFAHAFS